MQVSRTVGYAVAEWRRPDDRRRRTLNHAPWRGNRRRAVLRPFGPARCNARRAAIAESAA